MSGFGKDPTKRPLKVNVFAHMMAHQGMLEQLPLFPYFCPGDIVPTGALSLTLPETPRVHFYHYNDIPEVILCMAGDGGLIATGQLYLQQGTHGVTTFLRQPTGNEGKQYQIALIIIRMKEQGPHTSAHDGGPGWTPAIPRSDRFRIFGGLINVTTVVSCPRRRTIV